MARLLEDALDVCEQLRAARLRVVERIDRGRVDARLAVRRQLRAHVPEVVDEAEACEVLEAEESVGENDRIGRAQASGVAPRIRAARGRIGDRSVDGRRRRVRDARITPRVGRDRVGRAHPAIAGDEGQDQSRCDQALGGHRHG